MSIRVADLENLEMDFVEGSQTVKDLKEKAGEFGEEIRYILQTELYRGLTKKELDILWRIPGYIETRIFYLGVSFKKKYYNNDFYFYVNFEVPVALNIPSHYPGDPYTPKLSEEVLSKVIPLNDEIIEIQKKLIEIKECFMRYVNKDTSLTWLKINLPGVYKKLKGL